MLSLVEHGKSFITSGLDVEFTIFNQINYKVNVLFVYFRAAELMTKTGHTVTLKVAKQGAIYHGLATLLSQPSPVMQRGRLALSIQLICIKL